MNQAGMGCQEFELFFASRMKLIEVTETERGLKHKIIEMQTIQDIVDMEYNNEEEEILDLDL